MARFIISGRVQGVFFRQNTKDFALSLGLSGFVRNLSNGDVEAVVVGDKSNIKKLISFWRNNPGRARVENINEEHDKIKNEFYGFEIRG